MRRIASADCGNLRKQRFSSDFPIRTSSHHFNSLNKLLGLSDEIILSKLFSKFSALGGREIRNGTKLSFFDKVANGAPVRRTVIFSGVWHVFFVEIENGT